MGIIIASNYNLIIEALSHLLVEAGFNVCGSLNSLDDASHEIIFRQCSSIILTDPAFDLPLHVVLQRLHSISRGVPIILLPIAEKKYSSSILRESSLRSILSLDCRILDVRIAVKCSLSGARYVMPAIMDSLVADNSDQKDRKLSSREREVLLLIAKGCSMSEIADKLSLSVKTVSSHKRSIKNRLRMKSTSEIIRYAIGTGLLICNSA